MLDIREKEVYSEAMTRETVPLTPNQALRAFRRLNAKDSQIIHKAAERIVSKTGMKLTEALQVLASIGMYAVRHGE